MLNINTIKFIDKKKNTVQEFYEHIFQFNISQKRFNLCPPIKIVIIHLFMKQNITEISQRVPHIVEGNLYCCH